MPAQPGTDALDVSHHQPLRAATRRDGGGIESRFRQVSQQEIGDAGNHLREARVPQPARQLDPERMRLVIALLIVFGIL